MEVHKPRPIRHWRELLTEIGVIVLSVSIALAGEQAVEWAHWRHEVETARKTLIEEIQTNDVYLMRRVAYRPCMDRQIDEAEAIIGDLEAKRPPRSFTSLHTGVEQLYADSQWQSERSSQVLTHFPDAELALMARYYASLEGFRLWMDHEGFAWGDLSILQNPPAGLAASDFLRLRASLSIARRMNAITVINAERMLRVSKTLGLAPPAVDPQRVQKFCTLGDVAFAAYQRTLEPGPQP